EEKQCGESGRIGGGDAEEKAAERAGEGPGGGDADEHADGSESKGLKKNADLKGAGGGSEGHADADFLGALRDGVRDDGVDAEGSKNQGKEGEATEQEDDETARGGGFIHKLLQGAEVCSGQTGIKRLEGFANAGRKLGSGERRTDNEIHRRVVFGLQNGEIKFRAGFLFEREMADVTDDANDGALGTIRLNDLADG